MKLGFEESQSAYTSGTQKARAWTEAWVSAWAYCPHCGNAKISQFPNNSPLADFLCGSCSEEFELKSQKGKFGAKVADGAYKTKCERLAASNNPNLLLMNYDLKSLSVVNLLIVWALTSMGVNYVIAAVIGAEVTIIGNFLLIERFVFHDMRHAASSVWWRFAKSFGFNNAEALIRIPIMALMVETWHISSVIATGITLVVAFFVRFVFHSLVVYAPKKGAKPSAARAVLEEIDEQAMQPGEI